MINVPMSGMPLSNKQWHRRLSRNLLVNKRLHGLLHRTISHVKSSPTRFWRLLVGAMVFKRKHQKINEKSIEDQLIDDEYDRHEFIRQLDDQDRMMSVSCTCWTTPWSRFESCTSKETTQLQYYPIVRDLAKILILLNRPVELIDDCNRHKIVIAHCSGRRSISHNKLHN
jgi:hypothetical protein